MELREDGSATYSQQMIIDSSLLRLGVIGGGSLQEACDGLADEMNDTSSVSDSFIVASGQLEPDGSCTITGDEELTAEEFARPEDVHFSVSEGGWSLTIDEFGTRINEIISEVGSDNLDLFEDASLTISLRLPGTPSDDHNAHRIEDGRFVWEFAGADFEDAPVALRASSKADTSGDTWVILVIAGAVGGLVGAVAVLGFVSMTRRRRKAARKSAAEDDVSGNDTPAGSREPWTALVSAAEDADEDLPHSRYRPPAEET